jgi:drug/metabolite transporter (DMT)-like permease
MSAPAAAAGVSAGSILLAMFYGLAYLTAASSIILLNKYVLAVTPFHFPISLSSLGVVTGWLTSVVLVQTGIVSLEKHKDITFLSWVKTVLPIGFFTGVTLACGNMAYFYLSLSFLQMTKALSPVALFFILWISGLDRFHLNVFLAIVVIVIGTAVAAYAEVHFTWVGIALITVAETFEAIKSACYQFLLANKSFTMWEGMYFVSPAALVFLSILIYVLEWEQMVEENAWGQIQEHPLMFLAAGTLGFGVNYCSLGVIKHAGSLTLKVLAQMKSIIIIFFGMAIYGDVVSTQTALGYATAIVGFAFYNWAKIKAKEEDDKLAAEGVSKDEEAPLLKK